MSPTDNNTYNQPPQNLSFLYQRHRSRLQEFQRSNSLGNHDLDRREAYGEKFTRMYPRELRQTGASQRYPSPPSPHPVTSPLLCALGSTGSTAAQYTSDWTKSLPFFASNQTGGVSDSPPNAIPIKAPRDPVSASPPSLHSRSQPNNNGLPSLSPRLHPPRERRASLYSQTDPYQNYRTIAPLPHEDQAHFYAGGLPDLDSIGVPQQIFNGLMPGEKGYFCGWDSLGDAGHAPSATAENVLILGYEGGLNVYRISKRDKPALIGSLSGLKGAVIDAKILPWTFRNDPASEYRPYIALVIHGPVIEDHAEPQNSSDESAAVSTEEDSPAPSTRPASRRDNYQTPDEAIKSYRTTVEIYSLSTARHIETVYATPPTPFAMPKMGTFEVKIPPPIGDLKIDANGKYLVVASGESGEMFVFAQATKTKTSSLEAVRCIGKLWTTVEKRNTRRSSNTSNRVEATAEDFEPQRGVPLFSLSHRFLAIVPPNNSTTYSINGLAHLSGNTRKPPGIANHVAPPPSSSTCETDEAETIDIMNRVARDIAQKAAVAGTYLKDRGMEAFKSYWNTNQAAQTGNRSSYPPADQNAPARFPPTHGYNGPVSQIQSSQVAIYDLQRFLDAEDYKVKNVLAPLASFDLTSGCSLVSFSPNGHHLLTVSRKGDVQSVWSIMKMKDPRSGISISKPFIRNVKNFTRWTITKIIDVAWAQPHGQRFALLSENGTVHVYEIPISRFQWPPLRRVRRVKAHQSKRTDESPPAPAGYGGYAKNAFNGASSWVSNVRQRRSQSGQINLGGYTFGPGNFTAKAAGRGLKHGAKAIAKGANSLYHVNDNKLYMHTKLDVLRPRSIRFLTGRSLHGYLGVVAAGTVEMYQVRTVTESGSSGPPQYKAKISKKGVNFALEAIPSDVFARAVQAILESRANGASSLPPEASVAGHWALRAPASSLKPVPQIAIHKDWRNMIEADTNPPYQPFHTDRRVSLYAFPDPEQLPPRFPDRSSSQEDFDQYEADRRYYEEDVLAPHVKALHHLGDASPWLFGEETADVRLIKEGGGGLALGDEEDGDFEYNVVKLDDGAGTLIMNTVPRTAKAEEEFFEDGAELVEFTDDPTRA